jgi:hypothetical protein
MPILFHAASYRWPYTWGGRWHRTSLWGLRLQRMNDEGISCTRYCARNTAVVLIQYLVTKSCEHGNNVQRNVFFPCCISTPFRNVTHPIAKCNRPTQYIWFRDLRGSNVFRLSINPLSGCRSAHKQALGSTVQLILMKSGVSKHCHSYQTVIRHRTHLFY